MFFQRHGRHGCEKVSDNLKKLRSGFPMRYYLDYYRLRSVQIG